LAFCHALNDPVKHAVETFLNFLQLAQINEERGIKQAEQNKRLLALETLKGTFLSGLGQCQDHVRRVQSKSKCLIPEGFELTICAKNKY